MEEEELSIGDLPAAIQLACRPQNTHRIIAGRQQVLAMPRAWVLQSIEKVATESLDLTDHWEYRRLLEFAVQFSLRHLIAFVTVFALSIASGIPGTLLLPDGVWTVVAIHEEENGGMWHGEVPATGEPFGDIGMDYIVTIRDGFRVQAVNLGDTNTVWDHQLPTVGSFLSLKPSTTDTHGTLPVTVIGSGCSSARPRSTRPFCLRTKRAHT